MCPYKIAEMAKDKKGLENIKTINKIYKQRYTTLLFLEYGFDVMAEVMKRAKNEFKKDPVFGIEYSLSVNRILNQTCNEEDFENEKES